MNFIKSIFVFAAVCFGTVASADAGNDLEVRYTCGDYKIVFLGPENYVQEPNGDLWQLDAVESQGSAEWENEFYKFSENSFLPVIIVKATGRMIVCQANLE